MDILKRQGSETQTLPQKEETVRVSEPELIPEVPTELEKLFGRDGLSAIASTLNALQRG